MKGKKKNTALYVAVTIPSLILYCVLFITPVLMGIWYSLTDWNGMAPGYNFVGIKNYITLFTSQRFLKSMAFTGKYSLLLVVVELAVAMLLTLALTYVVSTKLRTFFRSVFFFPAVLSLVTIGLTWNEIFYRVIPQIGEWLHIGWLSSNILGSPKTAIWGILLANVWQGTSIPFVMLLAGIQNVPKDLYEAASLDGANPLHIFKNITIPFMIPVINVAFVLVLKNGITVFDFIQAMTGGGPMQSTESAAILIYLQSFKDYKAGLSTSYAMILLIVIAAISIIQQRISAKHEVGQL